MRIQLDAEWLIDCDDSSCQILRLKTVTGDSGRGKPVKPENIGKVREEGYGFYGRLDHALQSFIMKKLGTQEGTMTAQQILDHINKSMADVAAAVAKLPVRGHA